MRNDRRSDQKQVLTIAGVSFASVPVSSCPIVWEDAEAWKCLYVDRGDLKITSDQWEGFLNRGSIAFIPPGAPLCIREFSPECAAYLVTLILECRCPEMSFLERRLFRLTGDEALLIARMFDEAGVYKAGRSDASPLFGNTQMAGLLFQELLIRLIRRDRLNAEREPPPAKRRADQELVNRVIGYMETNLAENLTFSQICRYSAQSATRLKTIFKAATGYSVMEYYREMKIAAAKTMLREENGNVTQIADRLGYTSVYYFSRYFKKETGMSPREYRASGYAEKSAFVS